MSENKDMDKILESQIGDMGSTQEGLGHLDYIPGTQPKLTDEEKASLEEFESKIQAQSKKKFYTNVSEGWIPIDRGEMGTRSLFYPQDWMFMVRPATVEALKNWTAIDEENIASVNMVLNEIIKNCVTIKSTSRPEWTGQWDKINSWDRFWFIIKVREYSMSMGEFKLEYQDVCENCDEDITFKLTSDSLYFDMPDDDIIENYWDSEKRMWNIDPKKFGFEGKPMIHMYAPTLAKDNAIVAWMYQQAQKGKNPDAVFAKFLPFMLEKAPRDTNLIDKMIRDCYNTYKSWDIEYFGFMDDILKNISVTPQESIKTTCPNCGEEVHSELRFPNGIKCLFNIQSRHPKFGSK